MQQMFVMARFGIAAGNGSDPVSTIAANMPEVYGISRDAGAPTEGEVLFGVSADSAEEAGRAAVEAFGRALAGAGGHGRLLQVRVSAGPYWTDPRDLGVSCAACDADHDDLVCSDCAICADAVFDRFLDDLFDGAGVEVPVAAEPLRQLAGA